MGRSAFAAVHRIANLALFAALPALLTIVVLTGAFARGPFLYDFHGGLYQGAKDVVHGTNPYRASYLEDQADRKRAGKPFETVIDVPVYPAPALVAAVPFSLLPYRVAGVIFSTLSMAGLLVGLRLLEVTDWRCYGVAFLSWPVIHGLMLGALTPLLVLAAALAWRYRGSTRAAAAVAGAVVAKLFLWPLGVWLLATRRVRALVLAVVVGTVVTVAAWAAIGFAGLADYPRMLGDLSFVSEDVGVSAVAALVALGFSATLAKAAAVAVGAAISLIAWRVAGGRNGDRRAFGLAVVAALVASPIVWPHYLALVFVPIALAAPRLSPLWFAPLLLDVFPVGQTTGRPWLIPVYLVVLALPALALARPDVSGFPARPDARAARLRPHQTAP